MPQRMSQLHYSTCSMWCILKQFIIYRRLVASKGEDVIYINYIWCDRIWMRRRIFICFFIYSQFSYFYRNKTHPFLNIFILSYRPCLVPDWKSGQFPIWRFAANRSIRRIIHLRKWCQCWSIVKVLRWRWWIRPLHCRQSWYGTEDWLSFGSCYCRCGM